MTWSYLISGSGNEIFIDSANQWVFKKRLPDSKMKDLDDPKRSVELFNLINGPKLSESEKAFVWGDGWVAPFIPGRQATPNEIFMASIDIYNSTGRIMLDATISGNFRKHRKTGKIICIDMGQLVQFEKRDIPFLEVTRCPSDRSLEYEKRYANSNLIKKYYDRITIAAIQSGEDDVKNPKVINLLKALLVIKKYRPDIKNVNFLKYLPDLINDLAKMGDAGVVNQITLDTLLDKAIDLYPKLLVNCAVRAANKAESAAKIAEQKAKEAQITAATMEMQQQKMTAFIQAVLADDAKRVDECLSDTTMLSLLHKARTPLYQNPAVVIAASKGNIRIMKQLLDAGFSIEEVNLRSESALHWAAARGDVKMVEFLLDSGFPINQVNHHGESALHWASSHGHGAVIEMLCHRGADRCLKNSLQSNAYDVRSKKLSKDAILLLKPMDYVEICNIASLI